MCVTLMSQESRGKDKQQFLIFTMFLKVYNFPNTEMHDDGVCVDTPLSVPVLEKWSQGDQGFKDSRNITESERPVCVI